MKARALVIEDSAQFAVIATKLLVQEGFEVAHAKDGETGVAIARSDQPELILLDVSLPGIDGFEVCRLIREFSNAYIIMISVRAEEVDQVVGLTVGADDYVTKPFSSRALAARVAAMKRRPRAEQAKPSSVSTFGDLSVDLPAREVRWDGAVVPLTKIEFDLLAKLVSEPRRTFSREILLDAVWGAGWADSTHVVDVHVGNLRNKLRKAGAPPDLIATVRGVGFRFDPPA